MVVVSNSSESTLTSYPNDVYCDMKVKRANIENQIRELLKECEEKDWGYDAKTNDEFCEITFNHAMATDRILKMMEDLGVKFCDKRGKP